jgi:hypothetical protein
VLKTATNIVNSLPIAQMHPYGAVLSTGLNLANGFANPEKHEEIEDAIEDVADVIEEQQQQGSGLRLPGYQGSGLRLPGYQGSGLRLPGYTGGRVRRRRVGRYALM